MLNSASGSSVTFGQARADLRWASSASQFIASIAVRLAALQDLRRHLFPFGQRRGHLPREAPHLAARQSG
jgi:hypothetical protein